VLETVAMSAELLKQSVLFKDFSPVGLDIFGRIAKPRIVLAGQPLFAEGGPSEALYLVIEGRLQISMKNADGQDVAIGALGPGEHLGDMSLLSADVPPTHMCSVLAEANCKILEIGRADFQAATKEKPQACMKLLIALAQELGGKVTASRDALKFALGRVAR